MCVPEELLLDEPLDEDVEPDPKDKPNEDGALSRITCVVSLCVCVLRGREIEFKSMPSTRPDVYDEVGAGAMYTGAGAGALTYTVDVGAGAGVLTWTVVRAAGRGRTRTVGAGVSTSTSSSVVSAGA